MSFSFVIGLQVLGRQSTNASINDNRFIGAKIVIYRFHNAWRGIDTAMGSIAAIDITTKT